MTEEKGGQSKEKCGSVKQPFSRKSAWWEEIHGSLSPIEESSKFSFPEQMTCMA